VIARDGFPIAWSPDGRWIALQCGQKIRLVRDDGTEERTVAKGRAIGWEPQGLRIVYKLARELRSIESDGTRDRLILAGASAPGEMDPRRMWDPRGTRLALFVGQSGYPLTVAETIRGIAIVDASGAVSLDTRHVEPEIEYQPQLSWTPDGESLVYGYCASSLLEASLQWRGGIAVMSADGMNTRSVIEDSAAVVCENATLEEITRRMRYGR
jgi:hypothetical protein